MEKLIIERNKEDFYRLEVNDKGEYIEFDLADISLPERILKASEEIGRIDQEYMQTVSNIQSEKISEENKAEKVMKCEKEMCSKMRITFDSFLGEGACQKIFGDKNYYGMFLELFDALEPHFEKMKINVEKAKKRLAQRYLPKDKRVM